MNRKEELQRDFLKLQTVLRNLRHLRYNYLAEPENRKRIEDAIQSLGAMSDELKAELEKMTRPVGDYDI